MSTIGACWCIDTVLDRETPAEHEAWLQRMARFASEHGCCAEIVTHLGERVIEVLPDDPQEVSPLYFGRMSDLRAWLGY